MLKFFRTIRKKLIEEDNVRKYLLYAVGEILLVVIGILIALQINNWNENRKNRILENEYYCRFLENSVQDKIYLQEMMNRTRDRLASANQAIRILQSENPLQVDLGLAEYNALQGSTVLFEPNTTAYRDLISGSNLNLIQNAKIKEAINTYYTNISAYNDILRTNNNLLSDVYFNELLIYESGYQQARMKNKRLMEGLEPDVFRNTQVDFDKPVNLKYAEKLLNRELRFVSTIARRLELEGKIMSEINRFQSLLIPLCSSEIN